LSQLDVIQELTKLNYKSPTFEELGGDKAIMELQPDQRRVLTNYVHPCLAEVKSMKRTREKRIYKVKVVMLAEPVVVDLTNEMDLD
jgi:hypothetical protein